MRIYLEKNKYVLEDVVKIEEYPNNRERAKVTFNDGETQLIILKEISKIEY